jgi:hypothetical protein
MLASSSLAGMRMETRGAEAGTRLSAMGNLRLLKLRMRLSRKMTRQPATIN